MKVINYNNDGLLLRVGSEFWILWFFVVVVDCVVAAGCCVTVSVADASVFGYSSLIWQEVLGWSTIKLAIIGYWSQFWKTSTTFLNLCTIL